MLTPIEKRIFDRQFQVLQILCLGMLGSILAYGLGTLVFFSEGVPDLDLPMLRFIVYGIGALAVLSSWVLKRILLSREALLPSAAGGIGPLMAQLQQRYTLLFISWEVPAILGIVFFFLSRGILDFVFLAAVSLVGMAIHWPRASLWESEAGQLLQTAKASEGTKKDFFDSHAEHWDETTYNGEETRRLAQLVRELGLGPGMAVLDAGTGTGLLVPFLLGAVGERGSVVGLDISPGMIQKAVRKGFPHNVRFTEARAEAIPMPDACFDASVCLSTFPHFDDPARALQEIGRVLKPGSPLFILHLKGSKETNLFHKEHGGAVGQDLLPNASKMTDLLRSSGFTEIVVTDRSDLYLAQARKTAR